MDKPSSFFSSITDIVACDLVIAKVRPLVLSMTMGMHLSNSAELDAGKLSIATEGAKLEVDRRKGEELSPAAVERVAGGMSLNVVIWLNLVSFPIGGGRGLSLGSPAAFNPCITPRSTTTARCSDSTRAIESQKE